MQLNYYCLLLRFYIKAFSTFIYEKWNRTQRSFYIYYDPIIVTRTGGKGPQAKPVTEVVTERVKMQKGANCRGI